MTDDVSNDPRSPRLVTMQVSLVLEDEYGMRLEGYSTGLNEHGLAGRFNLVAGQLPQQPVDHAVQVTLDLPKERPFDSIHAKLIRAEPSWVPGYRYFVACRYNQISPEDVSYLRRFVKWREDKYFRPAKPPRTWYLFSNLERKQFGPLTTEEVMASLKQGAFSDRDMIWSAEQGGWVKFSEEAFLETVSETRRKRGIMALAVSLAVVLLAGGFLGIQQGWLDYGAGAQNFREGTRLMQEGNLHLAMQKFADVARFHEGTRWAEYGAVELREAHRRLKRQQDVQLARERLELLGKIPTVKQDHPLILNNFGDCNYRIGETARALEFFMQALAKNPTSKRLQYNIGTCYLRMGNYQTALAHYNRVTDEITNLPDLYVNMGICKLGLGKTQEAMDAFDRAARLNPEDDDLKQTIARALQAAGVSQ